MTSQFKTFLKFTVLAVIIAGFFILSNSLGKDLLEWLFIPVVLVFLFLIRRKISLKSKIDNLETKNISTTISWQRQLVSSLILSIVTFSGIAYLGIILMSIFQNILFRILNLGKYLGLTSLQESLGYILFPILIILLIPLIITIIRWILTIKHSVTVRMDKFARKSAERRIIKLSLIIGILFYIEFIIFFNLIFGGLVLGF